MSDLTYEELKSRLDELEQKKDISQEIGGLKFKVGEKGGVSVYGLGRFPVTLYYNQWQQLFAGIDELKKFLETNKSKLKLIKDSDAKAKD